MLKTAADTLEVWHSQHWGRQSQGWPTPMLLVTFLSHWDIQTWNCLSSRLILSWDDSWPYDTTLIWLPLLEGESTLIEQMEEEFWLSKASPSNWLWIPSHWSQHLCFWNFHPAPSIHFCITYFTLSGWFYSAYKHVTASLMMYGSCPLNSPHLQSFNFYAPFPTQTS